MRERGRKLDIRHVKQNPNNPLGPRAPSPARPECQIFQAVVCNRDLCELVADAGEGARGPSEELECEEVTSLGEGTGIPI